MQRVFNYKKYSNVKSFIRFELMSFIGRTFFKQRSRIGVNKSPLLLDLGVGENYTDGWVHADFYTFKLKFWKKRTGKMPEVQLDLRYPINCCSNTVDGVYSCHALEHLDTEDAIRLLTEIHRILKPGCYLRIIVPDIEIAVNFYLGKHKDLEFGTGCEAIGSFTQNWGHKSTWDKTFLSVILAEIGFGEIRKVEFGKEGHDKRLIKERESRRVESLVIEARKAGGYRENA